MPPCGRRGVDLQSRGCCATDARDDTWDSIGRPRGQMHGGKRPHMHVSSLARGLSRVCRLCTFVICQDAVLCMLACSSDTTYCVNSIFRCCCCGVAMCGLGKCSLLQQSYPTVWVSRSGAQCVCWVAWKARVVGCMPCTLVLTPYRAQNLIHDGCSKLQ